MCGEMLDKNRVCIVGAGPSGMSAVFQFGNMDSPPDFVCYEKQETCGGLWNFTWRTGVDQYGEPNHGGMYKYLWSNGPKEAIEFPDYTFEQHFNKAIPSFPPRAVLRDYLEGRWQNSKSDLKRFIKFNHVVRSVQYRKESDDFLVTVENLTCAKKTTEVFSHVIVATGIFNVPDVPKFPGMEKFNGRTMHSHDFREAREFKNQRLLVVGASCYSAEDIALQCWKYGAKSVICTWRTKPMGFKWPQSIEERPLLQRLDGQHAYFKDGSRAEIDCIILCTGYKYHFPFMENDLRLLSQRSYYPDNLYKGTLWLGGGNNKVFYLGTQDQYYSFTMFDVQALWACKYIMGELKGEPKSYEDMRKDIELWRKRLDELNGYRDEIIFQTEFVADLCRYTGYDEKCTEAGELFISWEDDKHDDILTYRDKSFRSIFTTTQSPKHEPWSKAFDDSLEGFLKNIHK